MHWFRDKIGHASSSLFGFFRLFHEMRPELLRNILRPLRVDFLIYSRNKRGYYMAAQRHEIPLRVLTNISRVSAPLELFLKCRTKTFCLCWVLRSKIAVMLCATLSNVLYDFGSLMNNQLGHVYIWAWASRLASVPEIMNYVEKLLLFGCLVFSGTLCVTVYMFQGSCFDEL